jgi:hypothetical protein
MDELVKELRNTLLTKSTDEEYLSMSSKYVPIKIDLTNYHNIFSISEIKSELKTSKNILFVDGGSAVLFESASFCVGFIRVGGIVYNNNLRIAKSLREFYLIITEINGEYHVRTYPETSFDAMVFNPEDESLKNGLEKCNVTKIISLIRRFAEIEYATNNLLDKDVDYILIDGTLEARYPFEDKYLANLYSKKNVCALSKTCTLTTKNGFSVTKLLLDFNAKSKNSVWYYNPIVINNNSIHNAELYFIKLHSKTDYVFRFEMQKGFDKNMSDLFSILVNNSCDPIFLGYPYGLIDVDQYVRVSDDELRLLKMKLSVKLGKDWNEFSKYLNSTNAHSILDKIKF